MIWPHLHITKTCPVFACNGSMTLNKLNQIYILWQTISVILPGNKMYTKWTFDDGLLLSSLVKYFSDIIPRKMRLVNHLLYSFIGYLFDWHFLRMSRACTIDSAVAFLCRIPITWYKSNLARSRLWLVYLRDLGTRLLNQNF